MSKSVKGVVVTFEEPVPEEYAEHVRNAILLMHKVADVRVVDVNYGDDSIVETRVRHEVTRKLLDVIYEERKK